MRWWTLVHRSSVPHPLASNIPVSRSYILASRPKDHTNACTPYSLLAFTIPPPLPHDTAPLPSTMSFRRQPGVATTTSEVR